VEDSTAEEQVSSDILTQEQKQEIIDQKTFDWRAAFA
jgi:hypothetical protein